LFEKIQKEMLLTPRVFMLDPCADDVNHKCENYYTEQTDGLKQPWAKFGTIFVNPPYSDIKAWVRKTYEESQLLTELDDRAVMLIPARTDTTWWHDYIIKSERIVFLKGRVKFGDSKNSAPFPSAVAAFGAARYKRPLQVDFKDWRAPK
jgi:phage N-6-adenine-methyltransferase